MKPLIAVRRQTVPDEPPRSPLHDVRGGEDVLAGEGAPEFLEASDAVERRIVGDGRAVQGADRASDDDVRDDAPLEQSAELADLD